MQSVGDAIPLVGRAETLLTNHHFKADQYFLG